MNGADVLDYVWPFYDTYRLLAFLRGWDHKGRISGLIKTWKDLLVPQVRMDVVL